MGFMYIVGHNVPSSVSENMLEVAREFFVRPDKEKRKISMHLSKAYRGYQRLGENVTGKKRDWHEGEVYLQFSNAYFQLLTCLLNQNTSLLPMIRVNLYTG